MEKKIEYIYIPGIGPCWRFRLAKLKGLVPCREIKRIVEDRDNDLLKITIGSGANDRIIIIQMSLDDLINLMCKEEDAYTDELGNVWKCC